LGLKRISLSTRNKRKVRRNFSLLTEHSGTKEKMSCAPRKSLSTKSPGAERKSISELLQLRLRIEGGIGRPLLSESSDGDSEDDVSVLRGSCARQARGLEKKQSSKEQPLKDGAAGEILEPREEGVTTLSTSRLGGHPPRAERRFYSQNLSQRNRK